MNAYPSSIIPCPVEGQKPTVLLHTHTSTTNLRGIKLRSGLHATTHCNDLAKRNCEILLVEQLLLAQAAQTLPHFLETAKQETHILLMFDSYVSQYLLLLTQPSTHEESGLDMGDPSFAHAFGVPDDPNELWSRSVFTRPL